MSLRNFRHSFFDFLIMSAIKNALLLEDTYLEDQTIDLDYQYQVWLTHQQLRAPLYLIDNKAPDETSDI